jgi:hypothetical protein
MDKRALFYTIVGLFKKEFFKNILTREHLIPKEIHIKKLRFPDGGEDEEANFWGYELVKDSNNYLISSADEDGNEVDVTKLLPVMPKDIMKVATGKGDVYQWVQRPVKVQYKNEQNHSVKELVNDLSALEHTNPYQLKLLTMIALSQLWYRANFRIASNGGFGKDSIVEICNSLFGDCGTVESPTIAKLEDRATVLKWLVVNEVVGIGKADWDIIQQFLLATGAHKNELTKHSRAFQNVKEIIDISDFSLSLFYNDITHYASAERFYFDKVTKGAVLDRFPAFRFYGKFTEDFNALSTIDEEQFMLKNKEDLKKLLYSFVYYKSNIENHTHGYNQDKLMKLTGRDQTNMSRLLKVVDAYCDSQEEFDKWLSVINNSLVDYNTMVVKYIPALRAFCKKHNLPWDEIFPKDSKVVIPYILPYLTEHGKKDGKWVNSDMKQLYLFLKDIDTNKDTYVNVIAKLNSFTLKDLKVAAVTEDKAWDWEKDIL